MENKTMFEKYLKKNADKQMELYAYGCPPEFKLEADGIVSPVIQDFRTVERYQEYLQCGFNVLYPQDEGIYNIDETWEESKAKFVFDTASKAGVKKILLFDKYIRRLSHTVGGLIGEGKLFHSEEQLDKAIAARMAPYKDHPAFFGVVLADEPDWRKLKAIGQIYRSIKRVCPKAFVQCNLYPINVLHSVDRRFPDGGDLFDRFKKYLTMFVEETGADYIMYDNYPFHHSPDEFGRCFFRMYFKALQIAGQVCKEKGVKLYFVLQSFAMYVGGQLTCKTPTEAQMFYQTNALLGFGAKQLSYYTYWSDGGVNVNAEIRPDNSAMVSRMGERTPLWYSVQKGNKMIQKLFPVISNFDYEADRYIIKTPFKSGPWHLEYTGRSDLKYVQATTEQEVAMIYELKDKSNNQYMYVVQNITYNDAEVALGLPKQKTTLKFDEKFTKIDIFDGSEWRTETLQNGEYTAELAAGYAEYILPY